MEKFGVYHKHICNYAIEKNKDKCQNQVNIVIKRKQLKDILGWFGVPSYIQVKFIDELERMELIKIKDKQNIILIQTKDDGWF